MCALEEVLAMQGQTAKSWRTASWIRYGTNRSEDGVQSRKFVRSLGKRKRPHLDGLGIGRSYAALANISAALPILL
jgi:hypothetical protein